MKHVNLTVSAAANGYTINVYDGDEPGVHLVENLGPCHIAKSREEVGKVVVGILNEVFKETEEYKPKRIKDRKIVETPMEAKDEK